MLRGNRGAYSVRSPRCSQTLLLQSQRTAGEMIGCRCHDCLVEDACPNSGLKIEDRIHDIWQMMREAVQLTLKMVPGGNG